MNQTSNRKQAGIVTGLVAGLVLALAGAAHGGLVVNGGGLVLVQQGGTFDAGNLAQGATPFALDQLSAYGHLTVELNDQTYGNSSSWIGNGATAPTLSYGNRAFTGINLGAAPVPVSSIAFGRDNTGVLTDRNLSGGNPYVVQYTQVPNPNAGVADTGNPATGWDTVGTLDYESAGGVNFTATAQRHRYGFNPVSATGVRLLVPGTGIGAQGTAIDEIELYQTFVAPPPLTLSEIGGSFAPNNLAGQSAGATPFAKDLIAGGGYPAHQIPHINDETYGNSNSWIGNSADTFAGVRLNGPQTIASVAWGRDNTAAIADRTDGPYTVQYTTVANPDQTTPDADWSSFQTINYSGDPGNAMRHRYDFDPIANVTGVRIAGLAAPTAVDEIELYAAPAVPPGLPTAGLTSWLKGDAGVITDGAGNVSTWIDQSGNGNAAVQTVPGNRPTVTPNAMAGKPVIDFSGSGIRHLNIIDTAALGMQNSDYEVFIVARSDTPGVQFLTAGGGAGGHESFELHLNGLIGGTAPYGQGALFIPNPPATSQAVGFSTNGFLTTGEAHVLGVRVDGNTGFLRVDGVQSAGSAPNAHNANNFWLTLGVRGSALFPLSGDIAEVLIYNRALTPAERSVVEQYLIGRWEVPINVAAASRGGTPFAKDLIAGGGYAAHQIAHLNDERNGNSFSWIGASANSFAGVAFDGPQDISAIAFGRDNGGEAWLGTDRFLGTYTLQYTTAANPDQTTPDSEWMDIMTLTYDGTFPDAQGYLRHLWDFDTIPGATGVRIRTSADGICIDEIEVHGTPTIDIPEPATLGLLVAAVGGLGAYLRRRRRV